MAVKIIPAFLPDGMNHTTGRTSGRDVDMLTIHVTEGSAESVRQWFNDRRAVASAHYMVRKDGGIEQFVKESDTAWHNGRVSDPTAPPVLARPHVNPNNYSIGIEHEGDGLHELTPAQERASLALASDICRRNSIPIDRSHIVGHHEVFAAKSCPGKISVDAYVAKLRQLATPVAPDAPAQNPTSRPAPPTLVWSEYLRSWLIVVREESDTEWYFIPLATLYFGGATLTRGSVPLSQMPR